LGTVVLLEQKLLILSSVPDSCPPKLAGNQIHKPAVLILAVHRFEPLMPQRETAAPADVDDPERFSPCTPRAGRAIRRFDFIEKLVARRGAE
jgi:hypothetical protein